MQSFPHPLGGGVGVGSVAAVCICSEFGACRRSWCCRFPLSSPWGLGGGSFTASYASMGSLVLGITLI